MNNIMKAMKELRYWGHKTIKKNLTVSIAKNPATIITERPHRERIWKVIPCVWQLSLISLSRVTEF